MIVVELGIDSKGAVQTLGLITGAGAPLDDLVRGLVLDIEPFDKPSGELIGPGERITCLLRLALVGGRKPSLTPSVACLAPAETIGDVAGQPMLAHKATHEARVAVEAIAGRKT